jgi:hypothetical protein
MHGAEIRRFAPGRPARDRRAACLAQAYACHDMALAAEDADDKRALHAMTLVWQILARRGPVSAS